MGRISGEKGCYHNAKWDAQISGEKEQSDKSGEKDCLNAKWDQVMIQANMGPLNYN